jgi:hypothetical protein
MRKMLMYLVLAVAAIGFGRTAVADFVNGSFETGNLSGWTISTTPNGVTLAQTVVLWDIDFAGPRPTSFAGQFAVGQLVAQFGVPEGIELTQNLNLISGETYTIGFDWSAHRDDPNAGNNFEGGIFDMIVNGNSIANAAAGSTGPSTPRWGSMSADFTATLTGAHTIGARITRPFRVPPNGMVPASLFQSVDNFVLTPAIPEPSTCWILGWFAAAGLIMRRRSAVTRHPAQGCRAGE